MRKKISLVLVALVLVLTSLSGWMNVHAQDSSASTDTTTGASERTYTDPSELSDQYDVVIVGAGGGGMAAAIAAHDAGAKVAILEKMPIIGGNTSKASGGMNASETKFQEALGIEDSNDKFYEETLKGGKDMNDPELLRYFVDHSAQTIDWLDSLGIRLDNITHAGGMSVKRTHRPTDGSAVGVYLVDGLYRNVTERKIPTFVNANVTEITQNNGAVSGVKVTIEGQDKTVKAKAVVLTTGGFGANLDMVTELRPDLKGFVTTNQEGSQGDGIKMAQALGAQTVDLDQIQIHPSVEQQTAYLISEAVRGEGAILVNKHGQRFFDELKTRDKVSAAIIEQDESYAYVVFDAALKERAKQIYQYEERGLVVKGDTVEELATQLGLDPTTFKATLDSWNQSVANQKDEAFGRTTGMEHDLSQAPFYAIKIAPGIHHTMGGLKINTQTQVLNTDNQPIKGLYAAGEVTGGIHGGNRIGGNAVTDIILFGRQAGEQSAAFVKE